MTDTYNATLTHFAQADIDWTTATLRVALVSDNTAYTPAIDSGEFLADVLDGGTTAEEFAGSGYARQTLANPTVTQDDTNDQAVLDGDDTVFPTIDGDTVQGVLVYVQVGGDDLTPGDDILVGYYDGGDYPKPANGTDFTVVWGAGGIFTIGN